MRRRTPAGRSAPSPATSRRKIRRRTTDHGCVIASEAKAIACHDQFICPAARRPAHASASSEFLTLEKTPVVAAGTVADASKYFATVLDRARRWQLGRHIRRNPRNFPGSLPQFKTEAIFQLFGFRESFLIIIANVGEAGAENVVVVVSYEDAIFWHLAACSHWTGGSAIGLSAIDAHAVGDGGSLYAQHGRIVSQERVPT
jgi:hypothetical protein